MTWPNFSPTAARGQWNQLLVNHPLQKNLKLFIHLDSLWQVYAFHWGWPTFCAFLVLCFVKCQGLWWMCGLCPQVHFKSNLLPFLFPSVHGVTFSSRRKKKDLNKVHQNFVLGEDFAQVPLHTHLAMHVSLRHTYIHAQTHRGSSLFLESLGKLFII